MILIDSCINKFCIFPINRSKTKPAVAVSSFNLMQTLFTVNCQDFWCSPLFLFQHKSIYSFCSDVYCLNKILMRVFLRFNQYSLIVFHIEEQQKGSMGSCVI